MMGAEKSVPCQSVSELPPRRSVASEAISHPIEAPLAAFDRLRISIPKCPHRPIIEGRSPPDATPVADKQLPEKSHSSPPKPSDVMMPSEKKSLADDVSKLWRPMKIEESGVRIVIPERVHTGSILSIQCDDEIRRVFVTNFSATPIFTSGRILYTVGRYRDVHAENIVFNALFDELKVATVVFVKYPRTSRLSEEEFEIVVYGHVPDNLSSILPQLFARIAAEYSEHATHEYRWYVEIDGIDDNLHCNFSGVTRLEKQQPAYLALQRAIMRAAVITPRYSLVLKHPIP